MKSGRAKSYNYSSGPSPQILVEMGLCVGSFTVMQINKGFYTKLVSTVNTKQETSDNFKTKLIIEHVYLYCYQNTLNCMMSYIDLLTKVPFLTHILNYKIIEKSSYLHTFLLVFSRIADFAIVVFSIEIRNGHMINL